MSLVVISPALIFPILAGNVYRGVNIGEWVDDAYYIVKGREILEGNSLGNIFLKIGKDSSSDPHQVYLEYVLLSPFKFSGFVEFAKENITSIYTFYSFLGVFLLVLSIYFLIYSFSENKLLSVSVALFTVGGYTLVKLSHAPVTAVVPGLNIFSRPIMPVYGLLILFLYINALVRSLDRTELKYWILPSVLFGVLFYVYPYAWTFALAFTGSLVLLYLILRQYELFKKMFIVFFAGLMIGSFTIYKTLTFSKTEVGRQILYYGITLNRNPAPFSKISFAVLFLSILFLLLNKRNKYGPVFLSIVLASWLTLNQQVLTGKVPQIMHYYWYFTIPTSIVVGSYLLWKFANYQKQVSALLQKYGKWILGIIIVAAFIAATRQQYQGMMATWEIKEYGQNYRPIIDYLKKEKKPGVVLTSEHYYGRFFSVYTGHDLFWGNNAFVFNTPYKRLEDALFFYAYMDRNSRNNFVEQMRKIDEGFGLVGTTGENSYYPLIYSYIAGFRSGVDFDQYNIRVRLKDPKIVKSREETINYLFDNYKKAANPNGMAEILKRNEVNFIVWDKNKSPEWDLSPILGNLALLTSEGNIYLYKVKSN
ncbi:hypothetical protein HYS99_00315 [Candidatus Giovannonibacteria bacterium]|nr:hypothetical protein [Candidatus Giovannonibacteria bacterium]